MLRAMLRGKLGRPSGEGEDEDGTSETSAWSRLVAREDPLTAVIFSRLAYLEPCHAWELLRIACVNPMGEERLPVAVPAGHPTYLFWPRLSPGESSFNLHGVEPDVLIDWGSHVFVVEAKHNGKQEASQWVNEIQAVRAHARFADRPLTFIAAGGADLATFGPLVAEARGRLGGDRTSFLLLRWSVLGKEAVALRPSLTGAGAAVVDDILVALGAWGYRRRLAFDSLAEAARSLTIATTPEALKGWKTR